MSCRVLHRAVVSVSVQKNGGGSGRSNGSGIYISVFAQRCSLHPSIHYSFNTIFRSFHLHGNQVDGEDVVFYPQIQCSADKFAYQPKT